MASPVFRLPIRHSALGIRHSALPLPFLLLALSASAAPRVEIRGRDLYLDGAPHIPQGMVHAGADQYPALTNLGMNSLHIDVAFRDYDPRRGEEENDRIFRENYLRPADEAQKNGMTVLWLFSFHYTPDWLWERHPDCRMQKADGTPGGGGWINMCLNHAGFREEAARWLTFCAQRLGPHPATLGYVLWNEPHLMPEVDYHPATVAEFRAWVARRYGGAEALNAAWGTALAGIENAEPPPPVKHGEWSQYYDRMVGSGARAAAADGDAAMLNPAAWMDWMRFRQENFAAFWKWEADVIRAADPEAVITSKIVPFDLYSSHAYGAGTSTELWVNGFLDAVGMDLYSHMDENFLARWKCDYFRSLSQGKPVWHTEFNFSFCEERGLVPPEQWRAVFYYQLSRGVNGFWNFMWGEPEPWTLHYTGYRPAPVTREIARLASQARTLAPLLAGLQPAPAEVAVLHSTTTGLALAGDYAATADQTTIVDLLYRSQTPFDFVTEAMVLDGRLKSYRVLVAVGASALPDAVLEAIRAFTVDHGGHVLANARFARFDERGRVRDAHPPLWMGARAAAFHRQPREKTGTLELRREARTVEEKPVAVRVAVDTWSSRPIVLGTGEVLGSGPLFGSEDSQMPWSCGGAHEMYWEDVEALEGAEVLGAFDDGKPAVVATPQTVYVARDTCWVDANFERFFLGFLRRSGVLNRNVARVAATGEPAPSVDLRMWEGGGRRLLFAINSAPTLHYGGEPLDLEVAFDAYGDVADALTGEAVPSEWRDFARAVRLRLGPGDVRVLAGRPYPGGWEAEKAQYDELRKHRPDRAAPTAPPCFSWFRSPAELWVYDARPELGIGMHGPSDAHFDMARKAGMRLVRHTVYWYNVERTEQEGVYDEAGLKQYDDVVQRARDKGIDLLLLLHGNPPGTGWANRQQGYERFARFAGFLAKRYPSVRFWELWNEMDCGFTDLFGAGRPDYPAFERGRCYARMLKLAYPAIKAANPAAWVLMGGTGGDASDWLRGIYEEGGRECFDFLNIHTYGVPVNWAMLVRGYKTKAGLGPYGDFDRPMWNTEFGIDAGNLWSAWRVATAEGFDQGHLDQWRACITEAGEHRLYRKILPYQFDAVNEVGFDMATAGVRLPEGHTIDDYGFGLVRKDGVTPRPTYDWLLEARVNRGIEEKPEFQADVEVPWDGTWKPVGYEFGCRDGRMIIRKVSVNALEPTVIRLGRASRQEGGDRP